MRRWRDGAFGQRWLRTARGDAVRVIFAGRPGGPAGPDFRDAVVEWRDGRRVCGDIELHVRASGWEQHGHQRDPRYNGVVLHVVERADGACATPLASGEEAPLVEVGAADMTPPPAAPDPGAPSMWPTGQPNAWPCARLAPRLGAAGVRALLQRAGDARFAQHVAGFMQALTQRSRADGEIGWAAAGGDLSVVAVAGEQPIARTRPTSAPAGPRPLPDAGAASPVSDWSPMDRVLCVALAEGLAYGRDRAALRAAGAWLADGGAPDALLRTLPRLAVLEAARLEGLLTWHARWQHLGPWELLRPAILAAPASGAVARVVKVLTLPGGAVSPARAAILAVNVVLPCAAAWARLRQDAALQAQLSAAYAAAGGLPANQITREMCRQLGLPRQPAGARAQQGLHHLWAQACRQKLCQSCPCAAPCCACTALRRAVWIHFIAP